MTGRRQSAIAEAAIAEEPKLKSLSAAAAAFVLAAQAITFNTSFACAPATFTASGQVAQIAVQTPAASFTLSGQAALFAASGVSSAGPFALSGQAALFASAAPSAVASFTLSGQAAQLAFPTSAASFTLSGQNTLFASSIAIGAGAFSLTGVVIATHLYADVADFALSGQSAAFAASLASGVGTYSLSGQAALAAFTLPAAASSYVLSGQVAQIAVPTPAASFTLSGQNTLFAFAAPVGAASFNLFAYGTNVVRIRPNPRMGAIAEYAIAEVSHFSGLSRTTSAATFALTGNAALASLAGPADAASFALSGQLANAAISSGAGAFALTGNAAFFPASFAVAAGSFALSGQSANIAISTGTGAFVLNGVSAIYAQNAAAAAFALTGQAAILHQIVFMAADAGSLALVGKDAVYAQNAGRGAFVLGGQPVVLRPSLLSGAASYSLAGQVANFRRAFGLTRADFVLLGWRVADVVGPSGDHIFLIELQGHDGSSLQTFYLSTSPGFISLPADTPANQVYQPRIKDPGNFERNLFSVGQTRGKAQVGIGDIVINNMDPGNGQTLDSWLSMGFDGRPIVIRSLPAGARSLTGTQVLFRGKLDRLKSTKPLEEFSLSLGDALTDLEQPLVTQRFAGTTTSTGATAEGNADLAGQIKQMAWGNCSNVPLQPANVYDLIYLASYVGSYTTISSITVYDGGDPLTNDGNDANIATLQAASISGGHYRTCKAAGLVRVGGTPTFALTADVVEGATAADRTAAQIAKRMLLHFGKTTGDLVTGTFTDLDAKNNSVCGYLVKDDQTALTAIQNVLDSIGGWMVQDRDGPFEVNRFEEPSGSPTLNFDLEDQSIGDSLDHTDSEIPVWRVNLQWGPNFQVQGDAELAGVVSATDRARLAIDFRTITVEDASVKTKHLNARELDVVTYLTDAGDAADEAARLLALYSVDRDQYTVALTLGDGWSAEPGTSITLTHATRLQMTSGRDFNVIGRSDEYANEIVRLRVWG